MLYYLVALAIVILDQISKGLVIIYMEVGQSIALIDDLFYLTSHRNAGAAFGILQDQRWFFIIVTLFVISAVSWYIWKIKDGKGLMNWSMALILGGAIGNFIDRLLFGEVVDFLNVYIPLFWTTYNFPIFNVADSALVIGAALLFIDVIREGLQENRTKKEEGKNGQE